MITHLHCILVVSKNYEMENLKTLGYWASRSLIGGQILKPMEFQRTSLTLVKQSGYIASMPSP